MRVHPQRAFAVQYELAQMLGIDYCIKTAHEDMTS